MCSTAILHFENCSERGLFQTLRKRNKRAIVNLSQVFILLIFIFSVSMNRQVSMKIAEKRFGIYPHFPTMNQYVSGQYSKLSVAHIFLTSQKKAKH